MASIRAGMVADMSVASSPTPIDTGSGATWSLSDGSTWTFIWLAVALFVLFVVL